MLSVYFYTLSAARHEQFSQCSVLKQNFDINCVVLLAELFSIEPISSLHFARIVGTIKYAELGLKSVATLENTFALPKE